MNQVRDVMTRGVRTHSPGDSLREAARTMHSLSIGAVPVCDGQQLIGMVTDRDLVIRGLARDLSPDEALLSDVMTLDVQWCYEDQSIEEAARLMCDAKVRRLPVIDHDKRLVGMISLGDVAAKTGGDHAAQALKDISTPARPDRHG